MPNYDYRCVECRKVTGAFVPFEARNHPQVCICGGIAEYQFPVDAINGFQPFDPVYVETLGCDVHSRGELKHILKEKGLQEAGDKVHGGRNFDPKANNIMPQPPKGVDFATREKKLEEARTMARAAVDIRVEGGSE